VCGRYRRNQLSRERRQRLKADTTGRTTDHRDSDRRSAASVAPSPYPWWAEFPAIGVLYAVFEVLRDHVVGQQGPAQRHARLIVQLERWTWTLHEHRLNVVVAHHERLAQAMDISYGTIHFLIPPLVLIWLWRRHPDQYRRWLYVIVGLTVASLFAFWWFPVAPPRLYPGTPLVTSTSTCRLALTTDGSALHFVDTDACFGGLGPLDQGKFSDKNPYAAMPSLHMAWSAWCACAVIAVGSRSRWRWLAGLYPGWTAAVVLGTANHWSMDLFAGLVLLWAAWFIVARTTAPRIRSDGRWRRSRGCWP